MTSVNGQSGSACEGPHRPATGHGLSSCAGCLSRRDFIFTCMVAVCRLGKKVDSAEKRGFSFCIWRTLRRNLEKEMVTHSSVRAWRIPGTGEPRGLPSLGSHRVGHD